MINNIFESFYIANIHPERLKPLSKTELLKGLTEEVVDAYHY